MMCHRIPEGGSSTITIAKFRNNKVLSGTDGAKRGQKVGERELEDLLTRLLLFMLEHAVNGNGNGFSKIVHGLVYSNRPAIFNFIYFIIGSNCGEVRNISKNDDSFSMTGVTENPTFFIKGMS